MSKKNPPDTIALVADGELSRELARKIQSCDEVIAVDGGLAHLDQMGIQPDLIIGDFDSVSKELLEQYSGTPIKHFSKDKDETDLELAVSHAIAMNPKRVFLFGVLGKRLDHTLTNLFQLMKHPNILEIESMVEHVSVVTDSTYFETKAGQTVSLFAFGEPATGVSSKGLKWELENRTIDSNFFSQSNEATGSEVTISVDSGKLLCVRSLCTGQKMLQF